MFINHACVHLPTVLFSPRATSHALLNPRSASINRSPHTCLYILYSTANSIALELASLEKMGMGSCLDHQTAGARDTEEF